MGGFVLVGGKGGWAARLTLSCCAAKAGQRKPLAGQARCANGKGESMRRISPTAQRLHRRDLQAAVAPLRLGTARAARLHRRLLLAWREPHRAYHGRSHLVRLLALAARAPVPPGRPVAGLSPSAQVVLALWAHDAVYDPARHDNEAASAALVVKHLGPRLPPLLRASLTRQVLSTATHSVDDCDPVSRHLCDLDLAILGASWGQYRAYAAQVRREYHRYGQAEWQQGRGGVLRVLLSRPRLYATRWAACRWEAKARRNLTAEGSRLTANTPA